MEVNDAEIAAIVPNYSTADFGLASRSVRGESGAAAVMLGGWMGFVAEMQLGKTSWNGAQETWSEERSRSKKKKQQ